MEMTLFWNPDSPPCRWVWATSRLMLVSWQEQIVSWSELKQVERMKELGTPAMQLPFVSRGQESEALSDSLLILRHLLGGLLPHSSSRVLREGDWEACSEWRLARLAESHLAPLLHHAHWCAQLPQWKDSLFRALITERVEQELMTTARVAQEVWGLRHRGPIWPAELPPVGLLALRVQLDFLSFYVGQHLSPEAESGRALLFSLAFEELGARCESRLFASLAPSLVRAGAQIPGF